MPTQLRYKPSYAHQHEGGAPQSKLTADTALESYEKLYPFLAIRVEFECPAAGWGREGRGYKAEGRSLFLKNGFHLPVRWQAALKDGWRRLDYDEFCAYYALPPFNERAK